MARRRKTPHPIIREIKRRMREIDKLKATARMLGVDLSDLTPIVLSPAMRRASRMTKRQARRQVAAAFLAPPVAAPPPTHEAAGNGQGPGRRPRHGPAHARLGGDQADRTRRPTAILSRA